MITPEQHAEIRRLYFGEHWRVGTIAAALGVHHDTVSAAIAQDTQALRRGRCGPTLADPYLPFMRDTLAQYPRLRATRTRVLSVVNAVETLRTPNAQPKRCSWVNVHRVLMREYHDREWRSRRPTIARMSRS